MKLDELPKKNIYEAPAGYFEKLPGVVMARVQQDKRVSQPAWMLWLRNYGLQGALAGLVLLLGIFFVTFRNQNQPTENPEQLLATVSKTEVVDYLVNTEQLHPTDLAYLSQAEKDISYEFIQATEEDIWHEVELADLNEITF